MAGEDNTIRDALETAVDQTIQDPAPEVNAPDTWSDEDKGYFKGITDPKTRQWLVTRDQGYNQKITEARAPYEGFDDVFKPYEDRFKTTGQKKSEVIRNLLLAQDVLEQKPAEGFKMLAQMYKIDPKVVLAAFGAPQKQEDAPVAEDPFADLNPGLKAFLEGIKTSVDQLAGRNQQTDNARLAEMRNNFVTKADEFRNSKDDKGQLLYPYMADQRVVGKMSQLLKAGIVKVEGGDLTAAYKNAYDQAVYSFTDIREKLQATLDQGRVRRARQAGASVRGEGNAPRVAPRVGTSVREQLAAALSAQSDNQQ